MKKILILFAAAALSACGLAGTGAQAVAVATSSTPIGDRVIIDEKLMYGAEALYSIPAQAYVSADTRGLITPEIRGVLRPKLITLGTWLKLVRQAYAVGDATSFNQRYSELKALKAEIMPLIPGANL